MACCPGWVHRRHLEVEPVYVHDAGTWQVTAAPAIHVQPSLGSLAYRVDTAEGSAVFTGDTQHRDTASDVQKIFRGQVTFAEELMSFDL